MVVITSLPATRGSNQGVNSRVWSPVVADGIGKKSSSVARHRTREGPRPSNPGRPCSAPAEFAEGGTEAGSCGSGFPGAVEGAEE